MGGQLTALRFSREKVEGQRQTHVGWTLVVNALHLEGAGGTRPIGTGIQCCCVLGVLLCVYSTKINRAI